MITKTRNNTPRLPSLRSAAEACGIQVWRQGAAWGFDKPSLFGRQTFYFTGAWEAEDSDIERLITYLALRSTRKGRRLLKSAEVDGPERWLLY